MKYQTYPVYAVFLFFCNYHLGTTNFSLTKMVTFHVLSNLTQVQHATFNLEGVPHLESLNVTLELSDSMAVQPGSIAWATFFIPLPSSTVIHPSSTINASHAAGMCNAMCISTLMSTCVIFHPAQLHYM